MAINSHAYITLDLQADNTAVVRAMQDSIRSPVITAQLRDGGVAWAPASSLLVFIRYRKPDGTAGFYDSIGSSQAWSVDGSEITFTVAPNALTVPGPVYMEINFYTSSGGTKVTTFPFVLMVKESVLSDAEIVSSSYYNVLSSQIGAATAAASNAEASAQAAEASAAAVGFRIYNSVEALGLTSGSAQISAAWAALPGRSILIVPASQFASAQVPSTGGIVVMVSGASTAGLRGYILYYDSPRGSDPTVGDFRMVVKGGTPSGSWLQIADAASGLIVYKSYSCTYDLGTSGTTTSVTAAQLGISAISGYVPIGISTIGTGSAHAVIRSFYARTSGNVIFLDNDASNALTGLTLNVTMVFARSDFASELT